MSSKHTPGPWESSANEIFATTGTIARVITGWKNWRDNVRLIRAAPDLLAVCEAALAYVDDDSRSPRRRQAMRQGLRVAIAEAQGES